MTAGSIVKVVLPQADGKLKARPGLVLHVLTESDVLVCGLSCKLHREVSGLDVVFRQEDPDFRLSGLRFDALIRVGFLATIPLTNIEGIIGHVPMSVREKAQNNLCMLLCSGTGLSKA